MTEKVKVAIAELGNCANSLIQEVEYYKDADPAAEIPGLMNVQMGDYHIRDIEFVAVFDVDGSKVGQDVAKAMWAGENNTIKFADVDELGIEVLRGPTLDGIGKYYCGMVEESLEDPVDVTQTLRDSAADVLVSYLPVGSEEAQKFYAQAALDAGVGFVNAIPMFIASDPEWANIAGDDRTADDQMAILAG